MDKTYERQYIELEDTNWWFIARRELIKTILARYGNGDILEIGCGSGKNIHFLREQGYNIKGIDNSKYMVNYAKNSGVDVLFHDATNIKFADESFGTILCLDMLEHVEDDKKVVNEIYRILKKKGRAIITVPAFKFLWGQQDIVNQHKRRYTKNELISLLSKFKLIKMSYWNFLLFFIVAPVRLFKKNKAEIKTDFKKYPKLINNILLNILRIDNNLIKILNLPFGVSLIAIVEK